MKLKVILLLSLLLGCLSPLVARTIIQNTSEGILLQNEKASILISYNAELSSCIELNSGLDIAAHSRKKIARATRTSGTVVQATRVSLSGDLLHLFFEKDDIQCKVLSEDDYFTFEVVGGDLNNFNSIVFVDLLMNYNYSDSNPFLISGVALSLQTNPVFFPSGEAKEVVGQCYAQTGMVGAKLAVVACRKVDLRGILKDVFLATPRGNIPVAYGSGGPFALDNETNKYDCVLIGDVNPSLVQDWISFYSQYGIRQFEFLLGPSTFVQGQFSFPSLGSAASFKEKITDPLYEAGIISTLHTYSFYISYSAYDLLSNPKWQKQLEFRESFALSDSISETSTEIVLSGDKSCLTNDDTFRSVHTPFVLIDDEIIKYTICANGLTDCRRGQCGTKAMSHRKGAQVKFIGGYYSHIAPRIGSELFYEIAHRTAAAYNEGGFRGFYFDALSGLIVHLKYSHLEDYLWYYGAAFINEVLKYCNVEPLVLDISDMYSSLWPSRGRGITWDIPKRGYKNHLEDHIKRNMSFMDRQYVATLGWYNFYPVKDEFPLGFSTKYMFFDDVDYAGVKSIAYDQTMTYNLLSEKDIESIPALQRNMDIFSRYSRLRQSKYFSDKVLSILRDGQYEYKLENNNGLWGFREAVYCREKIRDITCDVLSTVNPFKKQKPFIRLENGYSANGLSPIILLQSDELKDVNTKGIYKAFKESIDLQDNKAIRITVLGNGQNSQDVLCVRLGASASKAYADYLVRLNFEGWRTIVVPTIDNGDYSGALFVGMEDNVSKMHQNVVDMSRVSYIQIYLSSNCKQVSIRKVEAVPVISNSLTNPAVHIGPTSIVFKDTVKSGEYVEYTVGDKTALVYDNFGNSRAINVARWGRFRVPHGGFEARVTGKPELKTVPSLVILTFGLYGEFIHD